MYDPVVWDAATDVKKIIGINAVGMDYTQVAEEIIVSGGTILVLCCSAWLGFLLLLRLYQRLAVSLIGYNDHEDARMAGTNVWLYRIQRQRYTPDWRKEQEADFEYNERKRRSWEHQP